MNRLLTLSLFCLTLFATPSLARAEQTRVPLFAESCHLADVAPISLEDAMRSNAWTCEGRPFAGDEGSHVWLRYDAGGAIHGAVALSGMAAPVESIEIIGMAPGAAPMRQTITSNEMIAHWTPGNTYAVPLEFDTQRIERFFISIVAPQTQLITTELSLVSVLDAQSQKIFHSVLFAMCLGMLLIVALLSSVMFVATRNRDAGYHAVFSLLIALYVASASSLIFIVMPSLGLWGRSILNYASVALGISMLCPIVLRYFEPELLSARLRKAIKISAMFSVTAAFILPVSYFTGFAARTPYHLMFLPGIVVIVYLVVAMARKGSEALQGFLIAWAAPIGFGVERILRGAGFYIAPLWFDYFFFVALAFQAVVMTIVIALRADRIRRERDHAQIHAQLAQEQALRDALTGLGNRRAFDSHIWPEGSALVIFDVDRFKHINDTYGHDTGDDVLRTAGMALQQAVNEGLAQHAWRIGGEEFVVAISPGDVELALQQAEKVRQAISDLVASHICGLTKRVTTSGGIAFVQNSAKTALRSADLALYRAKSAGRDRLLPADDTVLVKSKRFDLQCAA